MSGPRPDSHLDALSQAAGRVGDDVDRSMHAIEGRRPDAVVYPADLRELQDVLSVASDRGLAVAPWGGGTRAAYGNPLKRLDLVVDMSDLNGVVEHNPADLTVTVQAGITMSTLQEVLSDHGQFVALDPPLPSRATLGGTLAVGLSGPLKWQYGSPRDVVIGMASAQIDGKLTRSGGQVVKNVSGYDMSRLHIGGLGTLGIIAEVSLKLTPLPSRRATVVATFDGLQECLGAALDVFDGRVVPLSMAAFDERANRLMDADRGEGAHYLAVALGGRPLTLERQIKEITSACSRQGARRVATLEADEAGALWRSVADFGWDAATAPALGLRASVLPSRTPELVQALRTDPTPAIVVHPAHGTVLAGWGAAGEPIPDDEASEVLLRATRAAGELSGLVVVEHASPGVKARHDVWGGAGEQPSITLRLKRQFDPQGLLNPGRFAGGI